MGKIVKIYFKDENSNKVTPEESYLEVGHGLQGDIGGGKPGRHVSILCTNIRDKVKLLPMQGLCTARFKENLLVSGDFEFEVGDLLNVGHAVIKITQVGKKCFKDCDLFRNKISCHLDKVAFGEVVQAGKIKFNDEVEIG